MDNTYSMSLKKGTQRLLDIAKNEALQKVTGNSSRYLVFSAAGPLTYAPVSPEKARTIINGIEISAARNPLTQP